MMTRDEAREVLYATAHELMARDRHRDALDAFRALMIVSPSDERGWVGAALCHEHMQQEHTALALLGACEPAGARGPRAALAHARILRKLGRDVDASDCYDEALSRADDVDDAALANAIRFEAAS